MDIPSFSYKPIQLIQSRVAIEEKHKTSIEISKNISNNKERLKFLINKIDGLDIRKINDFAYSLKTRDLYILAGYMSSNEYNISLRKIFEILKIRYRKGFLKVFLNEFQNHYRNEVFNKYFKYFLQQKNAAQVIGCDNKAINILCNWLDQEDIVKEIINSFFEYKVGFNEYIKEFGFSPMSELVNECKRNIYLYCDEDVYNATDNQILLETVKLFSVKELIQFTNNYLLKVQFEFFQDIILEFIHERYDRPDNQYKQMFWANVNEFAKTQFNKWLMNKTFKAFFGESERFRFWSKYLDHICKYYLVRSKGQLFIDFGVIVVIEFKDIGNAAYIYSKYDFEHTFSNYTNEYNSVSNFDLKNRYLALDRIIHRGDWQYKAAFTIRSVLDSVK